MRVYLRRRRRRRRVNRSSANRWPIINTTCINTYTHTHAHDRILHNNNNNNITTVGHKAFGEFSLFPTTTVLVGLFCFLFLLFFSSFSATCSQRVSRRRGGGGGGPSVGDSTRALAVVVVVRTRTVRGITSRQRRIA